MTEIKNILVIGATGNLGKSILDNLSGKFKITSWYRNKDKIFNSKNIIWHYGDVLKVTSQMKDDVQKSEVVIYMASRQGMFEKLCLTENVAGVRNILSAINSKSKINLIYFSSIEAQGMTGKLEVDEESEPKPLNVYGYSKLVAEREIAKFGQKNINFKYLILRLGNVGLEEWLKKVKLPDLLVKVYGKYEINSLSREKINTALNKILAKKYFPNKIKYLVESPMSWAEIKGLSFYDNKVIDWLGDFFIKVMKLTKKGGGLYYLTEGESKFPYRRFSKKLDKELR